MNAASVGVVAFGLGLASILALTGCAALLEWLWPDRDDVYPTDDEPDPVATEPLHYCTDESCACEDARFRYRLRQVARADAEAVQR